jgi:hypothetical protein
MMLGACAYADNGSSTRSSAGLFRDLSADVKGGTSASIAIIQPRSLQMPVVLLAPVRKVNLHHTGVAADSSRSHRDAGISHFGTRPFRSYLR